MLGGLVALAGWARRRGNTGGIAAAPAAYDELYRPTGHEAHAEQQALGEQAFTVDDSRGNAGGDPDRSSVPGPGVSPA